MSLKKLPSKVAMIIALSATLIVACDDTRIRVAADTGPRHHHSGHFVSHTPHNHRVSYDEAIGMYVVLGLLNTYWNGRNYYRYNRQGWQRSSDYRRWNRVGMTYVPSRLHKRHKHRARHRINRRHKGRIVTYH